MKNKENFRLSPTNSRILRRILKIVNKIIVEQKRIVKII